MFGWLNTLGLRRHSFVSRTSSRMLRVIFGMMFIYIGINLAGAWIQNDSNANAQLKAMVYKYDAVEIIETIVSDVGNALADSFEKNGQPTTMTDANQQTKEVSASLEGRFKEKIPAVQNAFEEIMQAIISPFRDGLNQMSKKQ